MTDSSAPTPGISLVKKKKGKKHRAKKKRRHASVSSEEETSDDEEYAKARVKDHAYEQNLARYQTDVIYKNLFPYL